MRPAARWAAREICLSAPAVAGSAADYALTQPWKPDPQAMFGGHLIAFFLLIAALFVGVAVLIAAGLLSATARDGRIESVDAQHIRTARRLRLRAKLFADCTGDACVGALAGADFQMTEKAHMGPSNLWNGLIAALKARSGF